MSSIVFAGGQTFSFGEETYENGGFFGPMKLAYLQILAVFEGQAKVGSDDGDFEVNAGEAALILNRTPISFLYPRDRHTRVAWCETAPSAVSSLIMKSWRSGPDIVPLDNRIHQLMLLGVELGGSSRSGVNEVRNTIGQALCSSFTLAVQDKEKLGALPDVVQRARAFVDANFKTQITVADVAEAAIVSRQHLTLLFVKHMGLTPARYIWHVRASQGAAMLMNSGTPIARIAYECGYQDPFHFSRHIRKAFGQTPRELRSGKGFRISSIDAEELESTSF
ncbi:MULTISPECIES: helix-turn-helix transcriptional regulator [Aminobacter]|jgi:AraC family L-rhamnose operon regulatory protein RhaS|uniref:AraC family L-rhamnose operon regulatory protein RhaS n=1 Tax=Aminobacter aminovorans TaxID=83263 RepID=A0AAC9ARZ1_AMIAI|nr:MULTISPECIES: AraC family transcriptional regulator [Aminobacter]AMS43019.1 hypothetical protein AA2016_4102 [Aminobacter aminovorans]MBB3704870.1 AraC family L-rhamnose operon regulatory protein RhaS [Aminobacter aminovorans]QOF72246.1 helix-turn-helix transcriptional regulator [Aminobacter sp. SR38]